MIREAQKLSELLRWQRLLRGWSQEEAAEAIGVATRTYQRWEHGLSVPNFGSQRMIRRAFEATGEKLDPQLFISHGSSSDIREIAKEEAAQIVVARECVVETPSHMIQLEQKEQALEQEVTTILDSSRAFEGEIQLSSMLPSQLGTFSYDTMTWFGMQVNDLKALGSSWQESTTCQQQQAYIYAELEKWRWIIDQDQQSTNEYLISRRMALATLATLSTSLLAKVQRGSLTTFVIEEFLAQCTTSITTCWHLMQGQELAIVHQALTCYLPVLSSWAKQPSSYQQTSAYLASQGCLLMGLLSLHSLPMPQNIQKRVFYCTQATEYAHLSADPHLLITVLAHLANAQYDVGQLDKMLQIYQSAISILDNQTGHQFPKLLRSKLQVELAHAYAQHGNVQKSLQALEEARSLFPNEQEAVPVFLLTDYGYHSLILFEGLTHLDLEKHAPRNDHSRQAASALAQIEFASTTEHIPERFRIEIINQQALAAIREGNLEDFRHYLLEGVKGAKALGSEKRRQEAIAHWKAARKQWPHEKRIMELADVLF